MLLVSAFISLSIFLSIFDTRMGTDDLSIPCQAMCGVPSYELFGFFEIDCGLAA
jgi:hypothetical protein